jgi:hypothetical protein
MRIRRRGRDERAWADAPVRRGHPAASPRTDRAQAAVGDDHRRASVPIAWTDTRIDAGHRRSRRGPGAGQTIEGPAGGPLTFKVRGEHTGGALTVFENVIAPATVRHCTSTPTRTKPGMCSTASFASASTPRRQARRRARSCSFPAARPTAFRTPASVPPRSSCCSRPPEWSASSIASPRCRRSGAFGRDRQRRRDGRRRTSAGPAGLSRFALRSVAMTPVGTVINGARHRRRFLPRTSRRCLVPEIVLKPSRHRLASRSIAC